MKRSLWFVFLVVLLAGFTACGDDDADDLSNLFVESGSSRLLFNNTSNVDLFLYTGEVRGGRPFAGVRGGRNNWGVMNPPSGLTIVSVVTRAEYELNPNDPKVAMSVLVFVDQSTTATYDIGAGIVGNARLRLINETPHFVELRQNRWDGPLFLTIRESELGTDKWLPEGEYTLYPIVKRTVRSGAQITGLYSQNFANGIKNVFLESNAQNVETFVFQNNGDMGALQHNECLIFIQNNFDNGGGASWVHRGSQTGPQMSSTLGRTMVRIGDTFSMSWSPDLSPTGAPLQATYQPTFILRTPQGVSQPVTLTCKVGYSYTIVANANGTWGEPVEMAIPD
jgi:hypothetical protein